MTTPPASETVEAARLGDVEPSDRSYEQDRDRDIAHALSDDPVWGDLYRAVLRDRHAQMYRVIAHHRPRIEAAIRAESDERVAALRRIADIGARYRSGTRGDTLTVHEAVRQMEHEARAALDAAPEDAHDAS